MTKRLPAKPPALRLTQPSRPLWTRPRKRRRPRPTPKRSSEDELSAGEVKSKGSDNAAKDKELGKRQLSFSVRSLMVAAVIAVLVAAVGVLGWLYVGARSKLDEQARQSENDIRAEKVALDYAVNAAAMSYEDLKVWKEKLVAGTSPELKDKLTKAATSMEQILVPLQWTSTASPLAAKVVSKNGGAYVVDSFVTLSHQDHAGPGSAAVHCDIQRHDRHQQELADQRRLAESAPWWNKSRTAGVRNGSVMAVDT